MVFKSEADQRRALTKNKEKLGGRWLEILPAYKGEVYCSSTSVLSSLGHSVALGSGSVGGAGAATGPSVCQPQQDSTAFVGSQSRILHPAPLPARPAFNSSAACPPGGVPPFAPETTTCAKLRGLPFNTTYDHIFSFFAGIQVGDCCVNMRDLCNAAPILD